MEAVLVIPSLAVIVSFCYITKVSHSQTNANRARSIIKVSIIGILTNIILVIFKMGVGLVAGSIAIVLDAVNNATDVLSSVVTIIGAKLASRKPDPGHPHGHGRFEYITSLIIGSIISLTGIVALIESIPKIFYPQLADYSLASIIVVMAAIITKLVLSYFVKHAGQKLDSGSLVASGIDAFYDAILSSATLIGIFSSMFFQLSLDGILGAIIAVFILRSSFQILSEATFNLLGGHIDADLAQQIRTLVTSFPEVSGAYDLAIHNYGPTDLVGSIHIQIPDDMTAKQIHYLSREITRQVLVKYGVRLTIGIYAEHRNNNLHQKIRSVLERLVSTHPEILQMHGFYVDDELLLVAFDLVIEYQYRDKRQLKNKIIKQLKRQFPQYEFHATLDIDIGCHKGKTKEK